MKKAIVLGANGFLGKNLTKHLLKQGVEVCALVQKGFHLSIQDSNLIQVEFELSELKEVELVASSKDKVAPEGFYSTSNHTTHILYKGNWIVVENIEMDCLICVDEKNSRASVKPIAEIKAGDMIVVGRDGIKVTPPQRSREKSGTFEFMNSDVSSEKPLMNLIRGIAKEIKEIKSKGGKIAIVGGPAIVHTGSGKYLAALIREGYIDSLLAGNALATHDIESNIFGTSLGIEVETGEIIAHGHTHHMRAINRINKSGSIEAAVKYFTKSF